MKDEGGNAAAKAEWLMVNSQWSMKKGGTRLQAYFPSENIIHQRARNLLATRRSSQRG